MKRIRLLTIVCNGENCILYNDDGYFISWSKLHPIDEIEELIGEATKLSKELTDEKTDCLKTLVDYNGITNDELENPYNFCLSSDAMNYIKKEASYEHWIHERQEFKNFIRKIQAGLF